MTDVTTKNIPLCMGRSCEHFTSDTDSYLDCWCERMRPLMTHAGGSVLVWMPTAEGAVCIPALLDEINRLNVKVFATSILGSEMMKP